MTFHGANREAWTRTPKPLLEIAFSGQEKKPVCAKAIGGLGLMMDSKPASDVPLHWQGRHKAHLSLDWNAPCGLRED